MSWVEFFAWADVFLTAGLMAGIWWALNRL